MVLVVCCTYLRLRSLDKEYGMTLGCKARYRSVPALAHLEQATQTLALFQKTTATLGFYQSLFSMMDVYVIAEGVVVEAGGCSISKLFLQDKVAVSGAQPSKFKGGEAQSRCS